MKLLFVFTGGTIGSVLENNIISTDDSKPYKLLFEYDKRYGIDFEYETLALYSELSENNTGKNISLLLNTVSENINTGYDGIVVTHGTDTLQYSAAALGYHLGKGSVPVCIVSANKPIEDGESNGLINLRAAVLFIKMGLGRGAFVPYLNHGEKRVKMHRATRLISSIAFSDEVRSVGDVEYGEFNEEFEFSPNEKYKEKDDEIPAIKNADIGENCDTVLQVYPYPAMKYPSSLDGVKAIILNTYHSGTMNTKSDSALEFFRTAKERGVKLYAVGVIDGPCYESASHYERLGITPIYNISPVAAFVKLWLLTAAKREACEVLLSLGGDI